MDLRELSRFGPSTRPHGELLFSSIQKKPAVVPDTEAFNSFIGDGMAEALYVIGLHGSGDNISRYLQDWEVAKVALSCQEALDMLCQELYEVERRRGWFGF